MKLIKAIKLHWKLRIKQEYACNKVCEFTQIIPRSGGDIPFLTKLASLNKAVHNVEKHIPNIYFILSDLFGGTTLLKKQCKAYWNQKEYEVRKKLTSIPVICYDLIPTPGF
jgi:hypothetical protein